MKVSCGRLPNIITWASAKTYYYLQDHSAKPTSPLCNGAFQVQTRDDCACFAAIQKFRHTLMRTPKFLTMNSLGGENHYVMEHAKYRQIDHYACFAAVWKFRYDLLPMPKSLTVKPTGWPISPQFIMPYLRLIFSASLLNIYLFQKTRFSSFKFNFTEFQQLRSRYANYTLYL